MSPTPIADLAQQLLQKIRIDQERRDKLLKLKFEKEDKKFKWNESDIDVNATVNYVKACQELHAQQKIDYATKLSENEVEYRNQMQLPFFVDFFFEIEEELFPELTEEALNLVNYVWDSTGNESEIFADEFSIQIKRHDLNTLRGLNWLNDEVINFYLNLIMQRSENHRDLPKVYVFNTFFLKTLNSRGYAGVKRWTRKVDIFDFDVLLIPVHLGNHWCLSVIDMKAREINYFDSLGGTNHGCLETLKNYLLEEHRDKKKSELNLSSWSFECRSEIPRQMNGSDCGVFTCCFAELSSRRLDFKFDQRIMPYYRQRMVYEICQKKLMEMLIPISLVVLVINMEVDPVEKSPASSTSSFDFLPELMGPLKQVVFECFTNEDDPVQFIGKFNGLLNEGLVSVNQNPEAIIQALIEIGCAKNGTNALLMPYLDTLWECKYFDYIQYIKTLISYRNLDKPQCVLSFITKIGQLLKRIDCDFRDDKLVYEMCDIFMFVLKWYSDLLSAIFSQRREDAIFLVKAIEKHIGFFGEDHFARYVAFCVSFIDPDIFQQLHDQLFATCEQMHEMSRNVYIPKETKELMEQLPGFIKSLSTKPEFQVQYTDTYRFGYNQPRPAILSLVTVYSVFRVLSTNEEIADALINIGNINLMSKVQILTDLFRGTFLILLDYHEADEVSADQHRDIHTLVLTEIFAYKRLASIVELLLETGQCTTDQLIEALTKLASNSVLLNALDRRQLDNTLASIINNSRIPQFLGNEYYKKIMELRMHSMEKDTELFYLLYKNQNLDQDQCSRYYQFTKANAIAQKMQESPETIDQLIVELIDQAELMQIDLVLACLCADEQIKSFSAKLSSFILSLEHTGNDDNTLRNQTFDSAFLLLTRIRQLFSDLRLEEITDGNTDSTFYKWTEKLYDYLEQNHALPINEEIKQSTFVAHFSRLKLGQAFWNNTWDFSKLLDHAPAVGEAVLDEVVSENKVDDESLKSILKTFGDTSCMFICLCQWLETNPPSEHLQMLATSLQNVGVKFIEQFDKQLTHEFSRWVVTMQLVSPALNRLIRGPRTAVVHDIIYPYLVNCARRQIRSLDPMEIPAMQVLKNAFFYGTQQGWASPSVIVCIDRMIKHVKQVEWIQNWFQQMFTKQTNADELEIASELCLAAAMTKPPICFLCIIQKIIDENEFMNNVNSTIGFNHTWILARMLVKAMLIVCWADERWKDKRKNFKRWQMSRKRKAEDQSDESTKQSGSQEEGGDDETVIKTLKTVFLFFQKEIKPSLIRLRITFICFFMLELAMSPISEYRRRLIQMIPDGMIFALCRLEPTCFNLPVLLKIYDMDNAEHRQMCLQLACMLRKTYH